MSALWCITTAASAQQSYFPIKTKAGDDGVTAFESKWYGESLKRMNEPRLPELAKRASADIYRLIILPTWGNSIVVRVQRHGELFSLSARRLDGQAGYNPGKLVESKDVGLDANDSKTLGALIHNLNFFELPTEDGVEGMDGDEWIIEGVSHGKYHVIQRWCAFSVNPDKRGLQPFLALCRFLVDKSVFSEAPKNRGHNLFSR
jgi:hypothetical protein